MPSRTQQSIPAVGVVGLAPDAFARAFPFHVACDDELRVVQVGESLARIAPDVCPGTRVEHAFVSARPKCELTHDFLLSRARRCCCWSTAHRTSRSAASSCAGALAQVPRPFLADAMMKAVAAARERGVGLVDAAFLRQLGSWRSAPGTPPISD